MWIAQNFIPDDVNGDGEMEDVGRKWFDKLVALSIFQPSGDNKGFVMPSHMHDLAVIVSSSECFFLRDRSQQIPDSVRHLAVDPEDVEVVEKIRKHKKLRSFLYFGSQVDGIDIAINNILRELDRIRVLDLSYLHTRKKKPPSAIQNMPHLRFLNLSSMGIKMLTHSRFDHYHLQSLHIVGCPLIKLPRELNKLINLRHLNGDAETIALISGIGKLTNLQELHEYRVRKTEGNKITELKNLRGLTGHLRIVNCENIRSKEEAVQARLVDKNNLQSVEISWSSAQREADIDMEILEGLQPYEGISELTVNGYMGIYFPDWMSGASHFLNLQTIRLISCINIEFLPFDLWQPPRLSTLEIVDNLSLRDAPLHYFSASLKALKIIGCHNLNSLAESLPHLTSLALLHVINCQLSISVNINGLTMLEELMLTDCPKLSIEGDLQSLINLKRVDISDVPFTQTFGSSINKPQRSILTSGLEISDIGSSRDQQNVEARRLSLSKEPIKDIGHQYHTPHRVTGREEKQYLLHLSDDTSTYIATEKEKQTKPGLINRLKEFCKLGRTQKWKRGDMDAQEIEEAIIKGRAGSVQPIQYGLLELKKATNNFSGENKLGSGSSGDVYKGMVNGMMVAIKKFHENRFSSVELHARVAKEVSLLCSLNHDNIVKLQGFCFEAGNYLLVYELIQNGDLRSYLNDESKRKELTWEKRFNIIKGIAKGLVHLHGLENPIIHHDLKPAHVLLDESHDAKISGFAISEIAGEDETHTDVVVGTMGYMAPELFTAGISSTKLDVYSFGLLIMEIIAGCTIPHYMHQGVNEVLSHVVWHHWEDNTLLEVIDPILKNESLHDQIVQMNYCIRIGLLCIQHDYKKRPDMKDVLEMLTTSYDSLSAPYYPGFLLEGEQQDYSGPVDDYYSEYKIDKASHDFIDHLEDYSVSPTFPDLDTRIRARSNRYK